MTSRSNVIYPSTAHTHFEEADPVVPIPGYPYLYGLAPVTAMNPAGRGNPPEGFGRIRQNVPQRVNHYMLPPSLLQANNRWLNLAQRGNEVIKPRDAMNAVFSNRESIRVDNLFGDALIQHTIPLRSVLEFTGIPLGQVTNMDANNYDDMTAMRTDLFPLIAVAAISYVFMQTDLNLQDRGPMYDRFQFMHDANTVFNRREGQIQHVGHIINGNYFRQKRFRLLIEFVTEERRLGSDVTVIEERGINSFEPWFLNHDLKHVVPGRRTRAMYPSLDANGNVDPRDWQMKRGFHSFHLQNNLVYVDMYHAILRWWMNFQQLEYVDDMDLRFLRFTFIRHEVTMDQLAGIYNDIRNIPNSYLPPISAGNPNYVRNRCDVVERVYASGNCQKTVAFPPSNANHNCYFNALRHCLKMEKKNLHDVLKYNKDKYPESWLHVTFNQSTDPSGNFNKIRTLIGLMPYTPIRLDSDVEVDRARHLTNGIFNLSVVIYNTALEVIQDFRFDEINPKRKQYELVIQNVSETRVFLKNPNLENGHVGVVVSTKGMHPYYIKNRQLRAQHQMRQGLKNEGWVVPHRQERGDEVFTPPSERCVFYDFETLTTNEQQVYVYAVGVSFQGHYRHYIGSSHEDTMNWFLTYLKELNLPYKKNAPKRLNAKEKIFLAAHNGNRFDLKFLFHYVLNTKVWRDQLRLSNSDVDKSGEKEFYKSKEFILKEGKILRGEIGFKYGNKFTSHDTLEFLPQALGVLAKDFNLETEDLKKCFPHRFMTSFSCLDHRFTLEELNDPRYYFDRDLKNFKLTQPWGVKELQENHLLQDDGTVLCRDLVKYYLKPDIVALQKVMDTFYTSIYEREKFDALKYMTRSALSFQIFMDDVDKRGLKLQAPGSAQQYMDWHDAVYGGRVEVVCKKWVSPALTPTMIETLEQWANLEATLKRREDVRCRERPPPLSLDVSYAALDPSHYVIEADFYSLYPSVMICNPYPIGECDYKVWNEPYDGVPFEHMGIYYIKFRPPKDLLRARLPRRNATGLGLAWTLVDGEGWYATVDIEDAWCAGYDIDLEGGWYWREKSDDVFQVVERAMQMKAEGDKTQNQSLREFGKTLANSLYGKMLQKEQTDVTMWIKNENELVRCLENVALENVLIFDHNVALVRGTKRALSFGKPAYLGVFVLAYSRRANWKKFSELSPNLIRRENPWFPKCANNADDLFSHPLYCDTDSMYITGKQASTIHLENSLNNLKNEDQASVDKGKGGCRILYFIATSVKEYCYVYINNKNELNVTVKCKGLRTSDVCLIDFIEAAREFGNKSYPGKLIDQPDNFKPNVGKRATVDNFAKMETETKRQKYIHKTEYKGKKSVNEQCEEEESGHYTVPLGFVKQ
jgi:hypothetical protein